MLAEFLLAACPPGLPVALEFRHDSWDDPACAERIAAAGRHGLRLGDRGRGARAACRAGRWPTCACAARATRAEARDGWRDLLEREAADRPVYAFAKHEGVPAGDPYAGVGLAQWLVGRELTGARSGPAGPGMLVKIIFPEGLCSTLVTSTVTSWPTDRAARPRRRSSCRPEVGRRPGRTRGPRG